MHLKTLHDAVNQIPRHSLVGVMPATNVIIVWNKKTASPGVVKPAVFCQLIAEPAVTSLNARARILTRSGQEIALLPANLCLS